MNDSTPSANSERRGAWLRSAGFVLVAVVSGWTAAVAVQCGNGHGALAGSETSRRSDTPAVAGPGRHGGEPSSAAERASASSGPQGSVEPQSDSRDPELEPDAAFALEGPSSWGHRVQHEIGEALPLYLARHTQTTLESVECRETTCLMQLRVSEGALMSDEVMATLRWAMVVGVDHCGYGTRRDAEDESRLTAYLHCPSQGLPQMANVHHLEHEEAL